MYRRRTQVQEVRGTVERYLGARLGLGSLSRREPSFPVDAPQLYFIQRFYFEVDSYYQPSQPKSRVRRDCSLGCQSSSWIANQRFKGSGRGAATQNPPCGHTKGGQPCAQAASPAPRSQTRRWRWRSAPPPSRFIPAIYKTRSAGRK